MASRSLRETFLGCKTGKRLGEDLYLKEAEKEFKIASFLKRENSLHFSKVKKGGQGLIVEKKSV